MNEEFRHQTQYINKFINDNNDTKTHIYLEQILLLPPDTQDKVINEISYLNNCNCFAIAKIIGKYSIVYPK